ncbi:MAG: hypothetical protein JO321_13985 [Solirubrobacterales bacterium]|nr:hypothetical protein [Solirubrobacterales bacterium]MBV8942374.1 hypothetical protein [Solirubrobacterales bacterium]MBV9166792.1 hypothetical protein [Solirubrobacterales bacterium]MBV9536512.1 hypothetical protein [Solirubrobacterales bacterium]
MQEEREEHVEETEEVEAHKRFGPSEEEPAARSDQGAEEDEDVEGHRWRAGPEERGKRF